MVDPAAETDEAEASRGSKPGRSRVTAENRYPVYDLDESAEVANAVKNRGGNLCSPDQLGGYLNYKSTAGGAFAQRVAAAKAFGFIETNQGKYRVTARGEKVLAPIYQFDRERAYRDAFLSVPLYRRVYEAHKGKSLPQGLGMQNYLLQTFDIPLRVVGTAVRVLMASAKQAGFFNATNGQQTHLIEPNFSDGPGDEKPPLIPNDRTGGGGGSRTDGEPAGHGQPGSKSDTPSPGSRGTLLDGLWELLPTANTWTEDLMQDWVKMLQMALRVRYRLPTPTRSGPSP